MGAEKPFDKILFLTQGLSPWKEVARAFSLACIYTYIAGVYLAEGVSRGLALT